MTSTGNGHRARIAYFPVNESPDAALTEIMDNAGYALQCGLSEDPIDIALINVDAGQFDTARIDAHNKNIKANSPEALLFFIGAKIDRVRAGNLRRYGEVVVIDTRHDHLVKRISETLRIRNIADEAGERLKSLTAMNRAVDFPIISSTNAPPRVLIIGPPGPAAIAAINALSGVCDDCICVLTAGQAIRALEHNKFDLAIFLPDSASSVLRALYRTLRRHPRHQRVAVMTIADTPDQLADAATSGASEFMLTDNIAADLARRAVTVSRRSRLRYSMHSFLRACSGDGVCDPVSRVFSPLFLTQHGARRTARADIMGRAFSLIYISYGKDDNYAFRSDPDIARQSATLLTKVLRAEDIICRVSPGRFAVVCPATNGPDASQVALRINGILSHSAFRPTRGNNPSSVPFDVASVERQPREAVGETLARLLKQTQKTSITAHSRP